MTIRESKQRIGSSISKLMLGGAMACLLAAPASATGWANDDPWAGLWGAVGIGAVVMDTDTKVSASRDGRVNVDAGCPATVENNQGEQVDNLVCATGPFEPGEGISASLFPLLQQQLLNLDGLSDAGVMGTVSGGYDFRSGNFVFGPFVAFDFYNVEAEFSSQVWAEGGRPSIEFLGDGDNGLDLDGLDIGPIGAFIAGGIIGASIAHAIRDEHIEIDGKIEQDYAFQVGGRMGYIWNETFMTYFGAAWTRTSIDGHVNINIADPLCGGPEGSKLCGFVSEFEGVNLANTPTNIRLDLDEEVDGYKLLVGGEYLLGYGAGGNWFLRGQAEYQDFDGITEVFSGQKNQQIFREAAFCAAGSTTAACLNPSIDIVRQINEEASASIDKEDYSVHAALVYKFGGAPVALGKPMK